ncbi:SUKH-4 family immunity protein [Paenibacillus polymyxa]|uniref:SUKH-4 family immunity protein n=1 Tax=Paenibacillus polymyxa TaxID=1406 RepID=UPI0020241129|nr:SUKH-4 family immunity protein [Paenibacillus polymyxa]URJ44311.1 SUKH-4 family immunity protein [Paenibacillus polymyxa]
MEYNVENIKKYYNDFRIYDYDGLIKRGIIKSDALFMSEIGVPYNFLGFTFFDLEEFKTYVFSDETYIQVGIFRPHDYTNNGIYVHLGSGKVVKESENGIVLLNRDLKTFFLFHLIFFQEAKKYNLKVVEECNTYGSAVRNKFEKIDPEAMENNEGYWSVKVEEYEEMW